MRVRTVSRYNGWRQRLTNRPHQAVRAAVSIARGNAWPHKGDPTGRRCGVKSAGTTCGQGDVSPGKVRLRSSTARRGRETADVANRFPLATVLERRDSARLSAAGPVRIDRYRPEGCSHGRNDRRRGDRPSIHRARRPARRLPHARGTLARDRASAEGIGILIAVDAIPDVFSTARRRRSSSVASHRRRQRPDAWFRSSYRTHRRSANYLAESPVKSRGDARPSRRYRVGSALHSATSASSRARSSDVRITTTRVGSESSTTARTVELMTDCEAVATRSARA